MKKIIATVLAMVMALALCTTAFAAGEVKGFVKATTKDAVISNAEVTLDFTAAKDPKTTDGKTTAVGNVAYYTITEAAYAGNYVVVNTLGEADLVVYSDKDGKNVMMYLDKIIPTYIVGTVITFGDKCGDYEKPASFDSSKTYYVAEFGGTDYLYASATEATGTLMVAGKLVGVDNANAIVATKVQHTAVPTVKDGKITGYTCSKCKLAAVEAPNYASIPTGAQVITGNWYFPVNGTVTPSTDKNTSPKTFDAGIAMYVGMALTSVAGSAVVIGKKKEF